MGAGNLAAGLIPEAMDSSLSYSVLNYLKRLKNQAKMDYDRIVSITPFKGKVGILNTSDTKLTFRYRYPKHI